MNKYHSWRLTQGTPTSALVPTINDNEFPE